MKKNCCFIGIIIIICLSLSACGKSEAVKQTEELINAIGEVSLESEDAIKKAETAYDALSEKDKEKVENSSTLADAREALDILINQNPLIGVWVSDDNESYEFLEDGAGVLNDSFEDTSNFSWKEENEILKVLIDGEVNYYYYTLEDDVLTMIPVFEAYGSFLYNDKSEEDWTFEYKRNGSLEEGKDPIIGSWTELPNEDLAFEIKEDGTLIERDLIYKWEIIDNTIRILFDHDPNTETGDFKGFGGYFVEYSYNLSDDDHLSFTLKRLSADQFKMILKRF